MVVFPFVPQVTITPCVIFFERRLIKSGHIFKAITPGEEEDFFPISLPATAEILAAHIAKSFRIVILLFFNMQIL